MHPIRVAQGIGCGFYMMILTYGIVQLTSQGGWELNPKIVFRSYLTNRIYPSLQLVVCACHPRLALLLNVVLTKITRACVCVASQVFVRLPQFAHATGRVHTGLVILWKHRIAQDQGARSRSVSLFLRYHSLPKAVWAWSSCMCVDGMACHSLANDFVVC